MSATKAVYKGIADVSAEIAKVGIAKDSRNVQQGYAFRGIDAVMNALAPLLAKHGLVILPRMLSRAVTERATQKGGVIFYVTVEMEFDFVSVADGSTHVVRMFGEAMDSADKATNKSASAAYKCACFQAFCIPTEGDADATTHEVMPKEPDGYKAWVAVLEAIANEGIQELRESFKASKAEYRDYRTKHDNARHEALKKHAESVQPTPKEAA